MADISNDSQESFIVEDAQAALNHDVDSACCLSGIDTSKYTLSKPKRNLHILCRDSNVLLRLYQFSFTNSKTGRIFNLPINYRKGILGKVFDSMGLRRESDVWLSIVDSNLILLCQMDMRPFEMMTRTIAISLPTHAPQRDDGETAQRETLQVILSCTPLVSDAVFDPQHIHSPAKVSSFLSTIKAMVFGQHAKIFHWEKVTVETTYGTHLKLNKVSFLDCKLFVTKEHKIMITLYPRYSYTIADLQERKNLASLLIDDVTGEPVKDASDRDMMNKLLLGIACRHKGSLAEIHETGGTDQDTNLWAIANTRSHTREGALMLKGTLQHHVTFLMTTEELMLECKHLSFPIVNLRAAGDMEWYALEELEFADSYAQVPFPESLIAKRESKPVDDKVYSFDRWAGAQDEKFIIAVDDMIRVRLS
jgi:hypothetical protein